MKVLEIRMTSKIYVSGKIIKRYVIPKEQIDELNTEYEKNRENLSSDSSKLAGRIDSEKSVIPIIQSCKIYNTLTKNMGDYIMSLNNFDLSKDPMFNTNILSCWINDMKPGEYNPPHTHHDTTGWSTVLFLKVPKTINDAKHKHKFRDGQLGFISSDGVGTVWMEPKVGDFYIFEAKHQHCVMPFKTKKPNEIRRSMSFNFIEKLPDVE